MDTSFKLDNNKKANRQAQALLKTWGKSEETYRAALAVVPESTAAKAAKVWFQSRVASVHYPRTSEARGCGGFSAKSLQEKAAPYEKMIQTSAKRYGVNPALVKSVMAAESCYREMVVSYKGASGLMQLMPETAAELGVMDILTHRKISMRARVTSVGYSSVTTAVSPIRLRHTMPPRQDRARAARHHFLCRDSWVYQDGANESDQVGKR